MPDMDYDFPELNRIGELLRDVGDAPAAKVVKPPKPAKKATAARFRLAATPLGHFGEGVNWKNDLAYQAPFAAAKYSVGPRVGAFTVASFAAGANWANSIGAAPLISAAVDTTQVTPTATLDNFMSEFAWD